MQGLVSLVKTRAHALRYILCRTFVWGPDMVRAIVKEIMRLTGFPPISPPALGPLAHLQAASEDGKRVADFSGFSGVCGSKVDPRETEN